MRRALLIRGAAVAAWSLQACTSGAPAAPSETAPRAATVSAPRPRVADPTAQGDDLAGPALGSKAVDVELDPPAASSAPRASATGGGPVGCTLEAIPGLSTAERAALPRVLEKSARDLLDAAAVADWSSMRRLVHSTRGLVVQSASPIAPTDIAGATLRTFDPGAASRPLAEHLRDTFVGRDPVAAYRRLSFGAAWRDENGHICVAEAGRWSFAVDEPWIVFAPTLDEVDRGTQSAFVVVFARDAREWRPIALLVPPWTP